MAPAVRRPMALGLIVGREQRFQRRRGLAGTGTPADEEKAEFRRLVCSPLGCPLEVDILGHRLDLGRYAVPRQHLGDRFTDLGIVDVAVVRAMNSQPEAVTPARLGQKFLGSFRIVRLRLQVR